MPGPGMDDADMPFELMHRSGPKVDGLLAGGIFSMRSPPGVMPGLRFLPCQAKQSGWLSHVVGLRERADRQPAS